jgi:hypothetical protein
MISTIKIFVDFFYGKRRPNLKYFVNGKEYPATTIWQQKTSETQEHAIIEISAEFKEKNFVEIKMTDKTDDDLIIINDQVIDHFVEIKNLEIDEIRLDHLLYRIGEFRHCMSPDWIEMMAARGVVIDPVYEKSTQIRLNGTWSMEFQLPVWKWCTELSV